MSPDPWRRPKPTHRLPSCYGLLSDRIRDAMWLYRLLGYVGTCFTEAMAYIELLEDELARREAAESR